MISANVGHTCIVIKMTLGKAAKWVAWVDSGHMLRVQVHYLGSKEHNRCQCPPDVVTNDRSMQKGAQVLRVYHE